MSPCHGGGHELLEGFGDPKTIGAFRQGQQPLQHNLIVPHAAGAPGGGHHQHAQARRADGWQREWLGCSHWRHAAWRSCQAQKKTGGKGETTVASTVATTVATTELALGPEQGLDLAGELLAGVADADDLLEWGGCK
jgi:hypothetical protein